MLKILIFCSAFLLLASCASVDEGMMSASDAISSPDPVTGKREINIQPEYKEIANAVAHSEKYINDAEQKGMKIDAENSQYNKALKIFNRIKKVIHRKHLPWQLHMIEDDAWNAFTVGGGKVFLYTGLFDGSVKIQSDDELAAVIAHEMAHVAARHASEQNAKIKVAQLVDKKLKTGIYEASFSTNQEREADKISIMYLALSGYNPLAAATVWERMYANRGSYSADLLHTHPLSDERAVAIRQYAELSIQYYKKGKINARHALLLKNNALFSYDDSPDLKSGKGGGFNALLEAASGAYIEALEAKTEQYNRQAKQNEKERLASIQLIFQQIHIAPAQQGQGLFGYSYNATNNRIKESLVSIKYLVGNNMVYEDTMMWVPMNPYERREFGILLKPIQYTRITISPKYVHFAE